MSDEGPPVEQGTSGSRRRGGAEEGGVEDWIGRTRTMRDAVTPRLAAEFAAMLAPFAAAGFAVPPGIFWCLAPDVVPASDLGADGHPRPGLFLPATGLPRRMWAGGELAFHGGFAVGDLVEKTTRIEAVTRKEGRSRPLAFVTVRHAYRVDGRLVVDERQDIVYRGDGAPGAAPSATVERNDPPARAAAGEGWRVETTPTLLFRYSALTFNGHRIHYDADYARDVEGYRGLVVHGPLLATLMLNLAAVRLGRLPDRFAYRGHRPVICGAAVDVVAEPGGDAGDLSLRILAAGAVAASATASASA